MGAGSLSVGPSYVYAPELPVGMTEVLVQGEGVRQTLFIRRSTHLFENGGAIV